MDTLLALRLLTLMGWLALAAALWYAVVIRGRDVPRPNRDAWLVLVGMHVIIALTAAMVELVWAVKVVAPESTLVILGRKLYNPAFLLNAAVAAGVPFLVIGLLMGRGRGRRTFIVAAGAGAVFSVVVGVSGTIQDWSTLMASSQVLSFVAIVGYFTFWGGVVLGHVRRADAYLLGVMAVLALFHILLPIQAEFFELVGRAQVAEIWHLHEFLQLALVATQLAIVLAYVNYLRGSRRDATHVVVSGGG